ncbi:arginine--tRNA ligase [Patescibacteria group bacterium]|nr:arginine--tRNA ligase [Patescibacteria group bacterium]
MESLTKFNNLSQAEKKIVQEIKSLIILASKQIYNYSIDDDLIYVIYPPENSMGDYSVPCYTFAHVAKEHPVEIAKKLHSIVFAHVATKKKGLIQKVKVEGPYLNFFVSPKYFETTLNQINKEKEKFGHFKKSKPKKIMIEYISLNTHKEFHVGHLRNVCLGSAVVNILRSQGDKIVAATYTNDFSLHVAQCLWGWLDFGHKEKLPKNKGKYLGQLYARSVQKISDSPTSRVQALSILKKLHAGDKELTKLWQKTSKWSLDEFEEIYKELGIKFDAYFLESQFYQEGMRMVKKMLKKNILTESDGAVIADLKKYDLGVLVFLRSDSTPLYPVADVPMALEKFKKYNLDESYYIVDVRQGFYFKQLFKILELLGLKKSLKHIDYEFVTLPEGAMASRLGRVILLDDLWEEVYKRAYLETKKRHPKWSGTKLQKTARAISWAAIKFGMLKQSNGKVIVFDTKNSTKTTGFTGPYLQYMYARISSILKKQGSRYKVQGTIDYTKLNTEHERQLIKLISSYPQVVELTANTFEPFNLVQYLYNLASSFSSLYETVPILKSDKETKQARLYLIKQAQTVLKNGLELLGIEVLDEM